MTFRRALVAAPLAIIVAIAAHFMAFGADHALGGSYGGEVLGAGLGASILLIVVAVLWLALTETDAARGERSLLRLLPGRGGVAAATGYLAASGFLTFAAGEALEGRSPLGTWSTALALLLVAAVVAVAARWIVRWLAAGGTALAKMSALRLAAAHNPCIVTAGGARPLAPRSLARGSCRGRAPPDFA